MKTVNSEIFARVYIRETSHILSFMKIKSSQNGKITLLFTDIGKSYLSREFLMSHICLLSYLQKLNSWEKSPIYNIRWALSFPMYPIMLFFFPNCQKKSCLCLVSCYVGKPFSFFFFWGRMLASGLNFNTYSFSATSIFTLARPYIKYMLHSLQICRHISCMVSILTI